VRLKKYSFKFDSYNQALEIIQICKEKKIIPILFIKYNFINGLGIDWLIELRSLIFKNVKLKNVQFYVDTKKNYGLFIRLVEKKINYIKVDADQEMIIKLKQLAKINKVLINPSFSVLELSKLKNDEKLT